MTFTLEQVLEAAASHPFYSARISSSEGVRTRQSFPLLEKYQLHNSILSAINSDPNFLRSVYLSPTGGTTDATPGARFLFVTDTGENRRQREKVGELIRDLGVMNENDIVLNLHSGQSLYRSLELTGDLCEYAGGTNIPVGFSYPDEKVVRIALQLRPNVITGVSSRILSFARYLLAHPEIDIKFAKVLYTSEPLPSYHEEYLRKAFHCDTISSLLGSAEGGVWGVAPPSATLHGNKSYREFVVRDDMMVVDIVDEDGAPVPEGEAGEIVLTSLMRLRNPLVRYRTGDIGSLHPYAAAEGSTIKYHCVHMYGRNPKTSFSLNGDYFDLVEAEKIMQLEKWGILEWQVILDSDHVGSTEESVEFRVVLKDQKASHDVLDALRSALLLSISGGSDAITANFTVKAVEYAGMEKGTMANKIRKIVDRR